MIEQGYWNGLPTEVERGTAVVADNTHAPAYWARTDGIIGQRIEVVRVVLDGVNYGGGIDYLDDRDDAGWIKVTSGLGSSRFGHRSVVIEEGSFSTYPSPGVHDSVSPDEILTTAPGPVAGGVPGLTGDEADAFSEALGIGDAGVPQ